MDGDGGQAEEASQRWLVHDAVEVVLNVRPCGRGRLGRHSEGLFRGTLLHSAAAGPRQRQNPSPEAALAGIAHWIACSLAPF
eukprot:3786182-Alexandrium_andersonii.AAC.1